MTKSPFEEPAKPKKEESNEPGDAKTARDVAMDKWQKYGRLGVTAQDHFAIGGSPPLEMNKQWGKTQAETMTDEQLLAYLQELKQFLQEGRERHHQNPQDDWARGDIVSAKNDLRRGIPYLRSINRLPKEFEDFEVQDLPEDPKER